MNLDAGTILASLMRVYGGEFGESRALASQGDDLQGGGGFGRTLLAASAERAAFRSNDDSESKDEIGVATLFRPESGVIATSVPALFQAIHRLLAGDAQEGGEPETTVESADSVFAAAQTPAPPTPQAAPPVPPVLAVTRVVTDPPRVDAASAGNLAMAEVFSPADERASARKSVERAQQSSQADVAAREISIPAAEPLRLTAIETHLPAAIAHEAAAMRALKEGEAAEESFRTTSALLRERATNPVGLLKFELEPPALGAIAVKMRMSQGRVEIQIDVQSAVTLSHLEDLRERIAGSVASSGCAVEALEIRLVAANATDMGQPHLDDGRPTSSQHAQSQGQEHRDGEGSQERRPPRSRAENRIAPPRGGERGGGVYL